MICIVWINHFSYKTYVRSNKLYLCFCHQAFKKWVILPWCQKPLLRYCKLICLISQTNKTIYQKLDHILHIQIVLNFEIPQGFSIWEILISTKFIAKSIGIVAASSFVSKAINYKQKNEKKKSRIFAVNACLKDTEEVREAKVRSERFTSFLKSITIRTSSNIEVLLWVFRFPFVIFRSRFCSA